MSAAGYSDLNDNCSNASILSRQELAASKELSAAKAGSISGVIGANSLPLEAPCKQYNTLSQFMAHGEESM